MASSIDGMRTLTTLTVTALALTAAAATPPAEASPRTAPDCTSHHVPVTLPDGSPHQVYGELCTPRRVLADTPVQLLLHGGTYDHTYWDWPEPRQSYVEHAVARGYATFNLDRIGYGRSDRVDGERLDFEVSGYVTHQVVRQLRSGEFGHRYRTVVLNGHSMGGITAQWAASHGGVDALVVSGLPKHPGPEAEPESDDQGSPGDAFYPAAQDPKFAGRPWADNYLTTRPGVREELFLRAGSHRPMTPWLDELLKDTVPAAELAAVGPDTEVEPVPELTIPTMYALGRYDALHCAGTGDCTTDPGGRGVDVIVDGGGHSINLTAGAREFYRATFRWLAKHQDTGGRTSPVW